MSEGIIVDLTLLVHSGKFGAKWMRQNGSSAAPSVKLAEVSVNARQNEINTK
jgi:hypothetical protein